MKFSTLLLFLLFFHSSIAQDPCAINAGSPINVCNDQVEFTLNGSIGANVDPSSLEWTTDDPLIFSITEPNELDSKVTLLQAPISPIGCYKLILSGSCDGQGGNQIISSEVEICIKSEATIAEISVDGELKEFHTTCHSVVLSGNANLDIDEIGCWYYYFQDQDLEISGQNCVSNELYVNLGNVTLIPCREYWFYYQITNGGCISTDSILVKFIGQDESVEFKTPNNNNGYCASELILSGTNIGCASTLDDFEFVLLNYGDFSIPPQSIYKGYTKFGTREDFKFYESGWYTFEYVVSESLPCSGGRDTISFYVCQLDSTISGPPHLTEVYCDQIPEEYTFENPINTDWTYENWSWQEYDFGPPNISVNGHLVTISNIHPDETFLRITQRVVVDSCLTETDDGEELKVECFYKRTVDLLKGPEVIVDTRNVNYLCGSFYGFRPWDYAKTKGFGSTSVTVLEAPSASQTVQEGQIYQGSNPLLNLIALGQYKFELEVSRINNNVQCTSVDTLCVLICNTEFPAAPSVSKYCVDVILQLPGTNPSDSCADPFWRQISGPAITFRNGSVPTDINPFISVSDIGTVCIEYSYSRTEDCYLADTTCFLAEICDSTLCLSTVVTDIYCLNQGTTDPLDDTWHFDMIVTDHSGNGVYWSSTGDILENGSYGILKPMYPLGTIANNPSVDISIFDYVDSECSTSLTVQAPPTCSDTCELNIEYEVSECFNNETSKDPDDDYFIIQVNVTGTSGQAFMIKQKLDDNSENLLFQGMGDQLVELKFPINEGDFTLWVFLSDYFDCLIDIYIDAPASCSGCIHTEIDNTICYDQGTSDPSDDQWSFDINVTGGSSFWVTKGLTPEVSGGYGSWHTVWAGLIGTGDPLYFKIHDFIEEECLAETIVDPPKPCSIECSFEAKVEISQCRESEEGSEFYVLLSIETLDEGCVLIKKKDLQGNEIELGAYYGSQLVELGPFDAGEDFTIWLMECDLTDCVKDIFVKAPLCIEKQERGVDYTIISSSVLPNPANHEIVISVPNSEKWDYKILDLNGQIIQHGVSLTYNKTFDISSLPPGIYFVAIKNSHGSYNALRFAVAR